MPGIGVGSSVGGGWGSGVKVDGSCGATTGVFVGSEVGSGTRVADGTRVFVGVLVGTGVRLGPVVLVGRGVTVGGSTKPVAVGYSVAVAKGVTVGARVNVAVGVRTGVLVAVGVRVGLGVFVLVGVLVGLGGALVGGTFVTTRVVPDVVVSTTSSIISISPAVPTLVGVGKPSTGFSGGPKSHAANASTMQMLANVEKARMRPVPARPPPQSRNCHMA
jgi:hypothetical protein